MLQAIEDAWRLGWTLRRKALETFLLPHAALALPSGAGVLACRDGSLVSLFEVAGARSMMGDAELARFVELSERRLNATFTGQGHALHVVFERAPDEARSLIDAALERGRSAAERLGLSGLGDVMAERAQRLAPLVAAERLVVACWSRPSALSAEQAKRERKRVTERLRDWLALPLESQCPFAAEGALAPRHEAFVGAAAALFEETGLVADVLDEDAAARAVRVWVNGAGTTAPDWRPVTVRNDAPARVTEPPEAGAFPPPLAPQLLIREPETGADGLTLGARRYAALDMVLGPRRRRPFAELISRLAEAELPFRFSLLLEGGGLEGLDARLKRVAASFLAFSSDDSFAARNALDGVAAFKAEARAVVRLRLTLLTWVAAGAPAQALARRVSRLQQLAEGWGELVLSPMVGDALEAVAGTVPGFACGGTASAHAAPLGEALSLWPVSRPAPLARRAGGHLFRTGDGKLMPFSYEEGEDYSFDLIYGVPGRGKSVLMNSLGLAFCLQGGAARLPFSAVIDIGPSSAGLISLIREALPPARRAEAGWFALQMTERYAINPCDTQLGARAPLPPERAFLSNLLGLMVTPAGAPGVPDGMREIIDPVITEVYRLRDERLPGAQPHPYSAGRDETVDAALACAAVHLPEKPKWWEVVDALFGAGETTAAARAQRYAVPTLTDCLSAVRSPPVQALIGNARYGAGAETVTEAFVRILTALSGSWPIMFAPTVFDIGDVRVAAIDLKAVAPAGSPEADRQTAAFYLLARHALTRHWWIDEAALEGVSPPYRAWHTERFRAIRETPKRLAFDEFHRTAGAGAVRAQVERDVREARKLRVRLVLSSQRLADFGEAMVDLANRYWVLGAGGMAKEAAALEGLFGLSETLAEVVRYELPGPGPDGAPALLIANDARGRFEQRVVNTPGPIELWALTTSPRDAALRDRLYRRLAPGEARAVLARAFPAGSAREAIEAALAELEAQGVRAQASETRILERLTETLAQRATGEIAKEETTSW